MKIQNITVHRCIIDEGASTCIMSKTEWQKLGSPELIPSAITLRAYDEQPSSPEGLFQNVSIELGGKTILIDIEVIDSPLDYNILFSRIYMYAMKAVASSIFRTMMLPHNGKIITIDQVSHYEPNPSANIDNILPLIHTSHDTYPLIEMGPGIFKDPSLLGTYHGAPPHGFPTLYPLTKNRVLSAFAQNLAISITHVPKTTFQHLSLIKSSTTRPATRLSPLWMDSLVIIKFTFTPPISIKLHLLPLGVLSHIMSCLSA
jgi:hypothetical protein